MVVSAQSSPASGHIIVQLRGTPLINTLTAFLGGAILLNVFIDEMSPERHSSFGWFVSGLVAYTLLLIC
jgi:hypothetical protein